MLILLAILPGLLPPAVPAETSTLTGRLLDWRGEPVRNAEPRASLCERWSRGGSWRGTSLSTDAAGRFAWQLPSQPSLHAELVLRIKLPAGEEIEPQAPLAWQSADIRLNPWFGEDRADVGDVRLMLPPAARIGGRPALSDDELEARFVGLLDETGIELVGCATQLDLEVCIAEMARRGGERWIAFLQSVLGRWQEKAARGRMLDEVLVLTALRRAEGKPDPLRLEITSPDPLAAPFPELPVLSIALVSADVDGAAPRVRSGGSYRSGRFSNVRVEASQGDRRARARSWDSRVGGGAFEIRPLPPGERIELAISLRDYVELDSPGDYRLRIQYHEEDDIDDLDDVRDRIVFATEPFVFRWTPRTLERAEVEALDVPAAVGRIDERAPVVLTSTLYEPGRVYQRANGAGEQGILNAGYAALPGLLELLEREDLSARRRAWILGLLYDLTGVLDPRGRPGALGRHVVVPGFHDRERDYPLRGLAAGFEQGPAAPDSDAQAELVQRWAALRVLIRVED